MKKIIIILVGLLILLFIGYKYVYQSHRNIEKEEAEFTINAKTLIQEFSQNQESSSKKYLNKTIIVEGELTEKEANSIMLSKVVYCTFGEDVKYPDNGMGVSLKIKGRCIGYDELLEIVKLDQVVLLE